MPLSVRPKVYSLPSYSLTGDLLAFLRCGLQYRYTRLGHLPHSRPVQLWFGEFIHGVLEEGYRRYADTSSLPPWPDEVLDEIRELIKRRLAARNLHAWTADLEELGDNRAYTAVQEFGPHLFPLIHRAEVRLFGARKLPDIPQEQQFREADRYEITGVVDVVTHIELHEPKLQNNPVVQAILQALPSNPGHKFEVIVDYKGMRRPSASHDADWNQYAWQLQVYGELRRHQADALPVTAGVLVYVNEFHPTRGDLIKLKREIKGNTTDIPPPSGSEAEAILAQWKRDDPLPVLPFEYRLARALRIIPIDEASIQQAGEEFDNVVQRIESCRGQEINGTQVLKAWERNYGHEDTCVVCISRTYCPDYQREYAKRHGEQQPRLPAVRPKPNQ